MLDQDIYGSPIGVHYKGGDTFKTGLGSFFTFLAYIFVAINFITLLIAFRTGTKQDEKTSSTSIDLFFGEPVNLTENDFGMYLTISPPIPANIGRIKVE